MTESSLSSTLPDTLPATAERAERWIGPALAGMAVLGLAAFAATAYAVVTERSERLAWEERRTVLVRRIDTLEQQVTALDGQVATLAERRKGLADEVAGLEARRGKEDSALKDAQERLAALRADETRVRERADAEVEKAAGTLTELRGRAASVTADLEGRRTELERARREVADLEAARKRLPDAQREVQQLDARLAQLRDEQKSLEPQIVAKRGELQLIQERLAQLAAERRQADALGGDLEKARQDLAAVRADLDQAQRDLRAATNRRNAVEGEVRWTRSVRQPRWRVKRESCGITSPARCSASLRTRASG